MTFLWLGLFSWLAIGLVLGFGARWFLPGEEPRRLWTGLAASLGGALFGGTLATALGFGGLAGFDLRSLVVAALGAILALFALRLAQVGIVGARH